MEGKTLGSYKALSCQSRAAKVWNADTRLSTEDGMDMPIDDILVPLGIASSAWLRRPFTLQGSVIVTLRIRC